jgi:hypothetical protein
MKIDDKSTIPLFAALGSLPVCIGFIVWLTNIDSKASEALASGVKIEKRISKQDDLLQDTHDAVIRIEEKIKKVVK